ncbi:hypothetical protein MUG84_00445 [Paenibacillus sp. KQZ6P-2]|uniref:Uncharacterized protein n=1 Tax=Paenibacillus mangrovi TaxID=2931978 RepID=A0A9X1WJM3_9BACL|nr:hypothetical protein [Paenibacillus mangrovi]MCJ8010208.1 hypothetical protein [Paenibacillus mangrovi]
MLLAYEGVNIPKEADEMKEGKPWKMGAAALMLASLLPAGMGSAAAALTEVPYAMDSSNQAGWWTPLETYGTGLQRGFHMVPSSRDRRIGEQIVLP